MDRNTLDYTLRRGLASLVRRLEELGETDLDPGQRVAVTLAAAEARQLRASFDRAAPEPVEPVATPAFDDALSVLIVDDNPTNRTLLESMMSSMGLESTSVGHGLEALKCYEDSPFDLVFMDVMLPGDDGIMVTGHLRERHGGAPYIVGVSALPSAESRCLAGGMDAFLAKPLHLKDLARVVEQCQAVLPRGEGAASRASVR